MADGSSVVCREAGEISIPLKNHHDSFFSLLLKDVLIIPDLDRRLFSVNAFLRRGNNWVHFYQHHVELGIRSGPTIKIPNSSLQSSAMERRKRRKLCRQSPTLTNTTNMNRIKFLQQELSYLQKQITKQQSTFQDNPPKGACAAREARFFFIL